ncbi:ABC transporter permease subunit [Pelagibaculum spongiae]|uniref:ABC transporter permease subunit n=1 Tax=Pelagibaculum spongiae TaxID=2080658 RepID=UPI001F4DA7A9|nr:ABC transporter permease subunit [Pelagibaculum spongiae]
MIKELLTRFSDLSGWLAYLLISLITLLSFYGLIGFSEGGPDWQLLSDSYFHSILSFSVKQALLSAVLSLLIAWPIARALYYVPSLPFKNSFLSLCMLCFVMPTLVLITGLVGLLGNNGFITSLLDQLLFGSWNLYGLNGILLAHVYLNMPFAIRIIYQQLNHIPDTSWQLAAQLKMSPWQKFKIIEWPSLSAHMLSLFGFVFVLCFNSFAIVLALGGGPQATTLEVAIYQSLKYDFNIPEALTLAWTQLIVAGGLYLLLNRLGKTNWLSADTGASQWLPKAAGLKKQLWRVLYAICWLCLLMPLLALLLSVLQSEQSLQWQQLLQPTLITLGLGLFSATVGLALGWLLLRPIRKLHLQGSKSRKAMVEWLASHSLVAPAIVVSVGLFIFLLPRFDIDRWGMIVVVILNTSVVIPFAIQKLKPRLFQFDAQYHSLARSLKLSGWPLWKIQWPFVRPVFLSTFGLLFVLAIGDVAIFSIFGNQQWQTLPWLIYSYAGSYRIAEASMASLVLLAICSLILWSSEKFQTEAAKGQASERNSKKEHEQVKTKERNHVAD